ncbi:helix-hairpin-helix domain-containing protein [bacterium]|nr:helix-hairpin-helix domain-containing protein [bacterium]
MLDFTKNEQRVLWFLILGFLAGFVLWILREKGAPLPELFRPPQAETQDAAFLTAQGEPVQKVEKNKEIRGTGDDAVVDINIADKEQLTRLPGIGPVMAERIITYRNQHGPFQAPESLMKVKGIGPKTYEKISQHISVDPIKEEI